MAAARSMLDKSHGKPQEQHPKDNNSYFLGSIGKHNIVIACLSSYGIANAAIVADQMLFSSPSIRFGLMVSVGGGIPSKYHDVRLGDIVVSKPTGTFGGVVQYDLGKVLSNSDFQTTGHLNKPSLVLLNGLASLEAEYELGNSKVTEYLTDMLYKSKSDKFKAEYSLQGIENDKLYDASYDHFNDKNTCDFCDGMNVVSRPERDNSHVVFPDTIASGAQVIQSAKKRDEIAKKFGALCLEIEAAGLMDNFPCVVIRGICDYAVK
jgi:nucleoside phosphorylase